MRIKIPEFGTKKELFDHLVTNKAQIIAQKKLAPVYSDAVNFNTVALPNTEKSPYIQKNGGVSEASDDDGSIRVKVVANTANWIDSHLDMILPGAATKSINDRKGIIPFLHDHVHKLEAEIADVVDIYPETMSLRELGVDRDGTTESVIFIADVKKEYNERIYEKYRTGKIKQHSIGLHYVKIDLAINDEDWGKEKGFWDKHYPNAINKEVADEMGFFWVVQEYKLIENSAVLFGSNVLTPTLESGAKNIEPLANTQKTEPSTKDTRLLDALNNLLEKI